MSGIDREPAIVSHLGLLWRRRYLIVFGSLIPALAVGAILYFWPAAYTATFVYERPVTEKQYNVLVRRFYSSENLGKIVNRLEAEGLGDYAEKLSNLETEESLKELIGFRVSPQYPARRVTTDPATSELISKFQAQLLYIDITADSPQMVAKAGAVIRDNIENVLPIYDIRNDLKELTRQFKVLAAEIEENRFSLSLDLQQEKARLQELTNLGDAPSETTEGGLSIEFTDVRSSQEFLPLSYQKRAVQSKIIDVQETLNSDKEKYTYYLGVLKLNDKLLEEIESGILTYYTVQQYFEFLGGKLLEYRKDEDSPVADYMKSYVRKTQNLVLVNTRAGESPVVYPVSKRTLNRAAMTLIVSAMVATFLGVVLEYRSERRRGQRP